MGIELQGVGAGRFRRVHGTTGPTWFPACESQCGFRRLTECAIWLALDLLLFSFFSPSHKSEVRFPASVWGSAVSDSGWRKRSEEARLPASEERQFLTYEERWVSDI
jgi:hypothetical protein